MTDKLHDYLRARLMRNVHATNTFDASSAWESHDKFYAPGGVLDEIVKHARTRKLMGAFRYEQKGADGKSYDTKARHGLAKTFMQRAKEKIELYEQTGNLEYVVDLFNYALLEYAQPYHPNAHFESTERQEEST